MIGAYINRANWLKKNEQIYNQLKTWFKSSRIWGEKIYLKRSQDILFYPDKNIGLVYFVGAQMALGIAESYHMAHVT